MPSTAASERAPRRRDQRPTFVLVGGVPGAGKSTLLSGVAPMTARTRDPDTYRRLFAAFCPLLPTAAIGYWCTCCTRCRH